MRIGMSAKAIFSKWYSASSAPDRERDRYEDGREMGVEREMERWEMDEKKGERKRKEGDEVESKKTAEDLKEARWMIEGKRIKGDV